MSKQLPLAPDESRGSGSRNFSVENFSADAQRTDRGIGGNVGAKPEYKVTAIGQDRGGEPSLCCISGLPSRGGSDHRSKGSLILK